MFWGVNASITYGFADATLLANSDGVIDSGNPLISVDKSDHILCEETHKYTTYIRKITWSFQGMQEFSVTCRVRGSKGHYGIESEIWNRQQMR